MPRHGRGLLLLLALFFAAPAAAQADCTITWNTDASGDWGTAANWSPSRVPNTEDEVCVDRGAANPTIAVTTANNDVRSLTSAERLHLNGGGLHTREASTLSGPLDLAAGALSTNAETTLLGTTTVSGGSFSGFGSFKNTGTVLVTTESTFNRPLRNEGTVRLTATLHLGAVLTNTSTLDIQGDHDLTGPASIVNDGTITKSAGLGVSIIRNDFGGCCFRIDGSGGTFKADTGTLRLHASARLTDSPKLTAATNARVEATTGTFAIAGTLTATGDVAFKDLRIDRALDVFPGAATGAITADNVTFANLISRGTLTTNAAHFTNGFTNEGTLHQQLAATFDGVVTNTGTWNAKDLAQSANGRIDQNGTMRGTAVLDGQIDGAAPTFDGTFTFKRQGTFTGAATARGTIRFENGFNVTGTLTSSGDVQLTGGTLFGGGTLTGALRSTSRLQNITSTGTLTVAGGELGGGFTNTGTLNQTADTLFSGNVTNTGAYTLAGKLTNNGNARLFHTGTLTGAGTIDGYVTATDATFASTGTLLFRDTLTTVGTVRFDGATIRFQRNDECCWQAISASGTLTGTGRVELVNGNLSGGTLTGTLHSTGRLNSVTNAGDLTLAGGSFDHLTSTGTVRQTAPVSYSGANSSSGLWDIQGDHALAQGGNGNFNNTGTIRKSAGTGTAALDGTFNSTHPTLDARAGTLQVQNSSTWTDGAQLNAAAGATIRFYRENDCCFTTTTTGTLTGSGAGRVVLDSGTLTGGTLDFAPGSFHARAGTLRNTENTDTIQLGDAHLSDLFTNSGTITQTGTTGGGYDGRIANRGTWTLAADSGLFSTHNNSFTNTGTVRRTGGTARVVIRGNFDNRGTVEVRSGRLAVEESTQLSNGRNLNGGTWIVDEGGELAFPTLFGIEHNAATIRLRGDAELPELAGPSTPLRTNSGTLALERGAALTLPTPLTNSGTLELGRSARLTTTAFTNTGTLATTIDGRPASGAYGALIADTATLGGTLAVTIGPDFVAAAGDRYAIVRATRTGTFAQFTGTAGFAPTNSEDGFSLRVAPASDTRTALRVTDVAASGTIEPGANVTVTYSVVNDGDPVTAGSWTDSIYLSEDGAYDPSDTLVGRVTQSANAYTGTLTTALPGVVPGTYRFLVVPDSRGSNPTLEPGAGARAGTPHAITIPLLTGTQTGTGPRYFRVESAQPVQIDATGSARVLVRRGAIPTSYDSDPPGVFEGGEPLYIAISAGSYSITAAPVAFAAIDSSPARGSGSTTITVSGTGFGPDTKAFVGAREASKVVVTDSRVLQATFELGGVAPGTYDLRLTDGARSSTLTGAFTVTTPQAGRLVLSTMAPPTFRIRFGGGFTVTFRNVGGADVPMPLLRVTASKAVAWAETSTGPSGLTKTSYFLSRGPGVVPPGGSVTVPFRFQDSGVQPHEFVRFKTELVAPDDQPIDWTPRKAGLRPAGISPAAWDQIWPTFTALVGTTNKSYIAALREAATRASAAGRTIPGEAELLLELRERAIARAAGAPVRGTLRIAGKPAAGKVLMFFDAAGNGDTVRTDDEGAFSVWDLPAGTYTVALRGRELEPWGTVTVPSGALNIELPGAGQIAGVVRDARGKPVVDARVEGRGGKLLYVARTDKQGRFLLDEVLPGSVRVRVLPPGAAPPAVQTVTAPGTLEFTVGKGAVVEGTIRKPDGGAAAGAIVRVGSEQAVTDAAGNYIVDALSGGTYTLSAHLDGFGSVSRPVTVAENGAATGDLQLDVEGRITGTVTPAEARVVLIDPGARQEPVSGGAFTLRGLSAGEHTVMVTADGFASERRTVTLAAGESKAISVSLARAGSIRGTAPAGTTAYLRGPARAETATGEFVFEELPVGTYAVALDPTMTVARRMVTVTASGEAVVDFGTTRALTGTTGRAGVPVTLLRDGEAVDSTVSGSGGGFRFAVVGDGPHTVRAALAGYGIATGPGGALTPGPATLTVRTAGGADVTVDDLQTRASETGTASFPGLPAGEYLVTVRKGGDVARRTVTVPSGGTTIDVTPAAAQTISGTVRTAAGAPLPGAGILATSADGATAFAISGPDGRYTLAGLVPGPYTVAIGDGRRRLTTRNVVASSEPAPAAPAAPAAGDDTTHGAAGDAADSPRGATGAAAAAAAGLAGGSARVIVDAALADVAAPVIVATDGAARVVLESGGVPVLLAGAASGLSGQVSLGGLEPSRAYRLTLRAPGRAAVHTSFTTDAGGVPQGLPATIALGPTVSIPGATPTSGGGKARAATASAAGPDDSIKDKIFHMFDVAGWYIKAPKQADFDTTPWRFEWARYATNSCDPDLAADLAAARDASDAIQKALSDWDIEYQKGRDVRADDMVKVTASATQLAASAALVLTGLAQMEAAVFAAQAANGALSSTQLALLGIIGNTAQSLNVAVNDLASGKSLTEGWSSTVDHMTGILGSFFTAMGEVPGVEGLSAARGLGGMSNLFAFVDVIKSAYYDMAELQNAVEENEAKTVGAYLDAQGKYNAALLKYKAALDRLKHYQAPPGAECPDPPPPTPPVVVGDPLDEPNIEGIASDDPNDITGPAGAGTDHYLAPNERMDYSIRFENKATASLPARTVTITHVLDADADLSTFQLGSFGFGEHVIVAPPRRQSWATTIDDTADSGTVVEVRARLEAATRTVSWTFTALDERTGDQPADPLTGFLKPAGGGFVNYAVKALDGERRLDAQARIVFDANPHIDTNVYVNAIDATAPTSSVTALPATTTDVAIPVSWAGTDAGSGVGSYDVFVSVDGGAPTRWLTTADTSAVYPGAVGHTYAFHTVATDRVGHVQSTPSAAVSTAVVAPPPPPPGGGGDQPPIVQPNPPVVTPPVVVPSTYKPALTIKRVKRGEYRVTVRNAGSVADGFVLRVKKVSGVKVLAGRKNVTKAAVAGSYRTARLAPGKTVTLTIRTTRRTTVTATSVARPAARAVVNVR